MCAARCHRSLKRDEEITLWRSLCALGAPLYGNLCISFSPSLSSLFLSPSLFLSLSATRLSLFTSRLFLSSPSFPRCSSTSPRALLSLLQPPHPRPPHSLGEAYASQHFSYSIVLFSGFPLISSLCSFLFFSLDSLSLFLSHSSNLFAHLYLCPSFPF